MIDKTKIDLNAPAFGEKAQKLEDVVQTEEPKEEPVVKAEAPTEEVEKEEVAETSEEESKVPYSRFKKFHDEAKRFQEEAEMWRAKAEAKPDRIVEEIKPDEIWTKLYGDSPESKEAYKLQQQREEALEQRFREKALEAVRAEKYEEAERTEKNLETLDDHLEQVSAVAGRDLTEKEESRILDIIDDYTPKGTDGSYAGAMLSPDKAWRIYELETQAKEAPKRQSRDVVASLSGTKNQGESQAAKDERNKNFQPGDWSGWRNRLNN